MTPQEFRNSLEFVQSILNIDLVPSLTLLEATNTVPYDILNQIITAESTIQTSLNALIILAASIDSTVTSSDMPAGSVLQVVHFSSSALANGGSIIPADNTRPQITEGNQYVNVSITPKRVNSFLKIDFNIVLESSAAGRLMVSLFRDSLADAILVVHDYPTTNYMACYIGTTVVPSNSIDLTTFQIRYGLDRVGSVTVNGKSNASLFSFGGALMSTITITEIAG